MMSSVCCCVVASERPRNSGNWRKFTNFAAATAAGGSARALLTKKRVEARNPKTAHSSAAVAVSSGEKVAAAARSHTAEIANYPPPPGLRAANRTDAVWEGACSSSRLNMRDRQADRRAKKQASKRMGNGRRRSLSLSRNGLGNSIQGSSARNLQNSQAQLHSIASLLVLAGYRVLHQKRRRRPFLNTLPPSLAHHPVQKVKIHLTNAAVNDLSTLVRYYSHHPTVETLIAQLAAGSRSLWHTQSISPSSRRRITHSFILPNSTCLNEGRQSIRSSSCSSHSYDLIHGS